MGTEMQGGPKSRESAEGKQTGAGDSRQVARRYSVVLV